MVRLVTAPLLHPVSLQEAKDHLRVTGTAEDGYISGLIGAATEAVQQVTRRQLEPATYDLFLDQFPSAGPIDIPLPPLQSVASVNYVDVNGVEQSFADFEADTVNGRVAPKFGAYWPEVRAVANAVRIRFTAGYPTGGTPFSIKAAILLLIGGLYEQRESQSPEKLHDNPAVDRLTWPFRVFA
jgi:uncharacterized phiE125 gp8 family phage protein